MLLPIGCVGCTYHVHKDTRSSGISMQGSAASPSRPTVLPAVTLLLLSLLQPVAFGGTTDYGQLLAQPARLHGATHKAGLLPISRWDQTEFNQTPFTDWLLQTTVYNLHHGRPPRSGSYPFPLSSPCGAWISHDLQLIIIVQRLAGAAAVLDGFGRCKQVKGKKKKKEEQKDSSNGCFALLSMDDLASKEEAERIWSSYFVVSVVRNPYSRVVSSYEHLALNWRDIEPPCTPPSFADFCADPTTMGRVSNLFRCCGKGGKDNMWVHDFSAVEPIALCLTTESGQLAVDYLIRSERLAEDLAAAVEAANEARGKDTAMVVLPDSLQSHVLHNATLHGTDSPDHPLLMQHMEAFATCGDTCARSIESWYEVDFKLFFDD